MTMRILIVEDERKTAVSLQRGLSEEGFDVTLAARGDEGLARARAGEFDLLVLDIMLPRKDGWEVLAEFRRRGGRTPVLCLTARDSIADRVKGLELGADDYLVKPFAFAELVARIRALLRRGPLHPAELVRVADLQVDLRTRTVTRCGHPLQLAQREFDLVALLASRAGEVQSRETLAREVWGMEVDGRSGAIDVAVHRVRGKVDLPFGKSLIHTVRGVGYVLEAR